MPLAGTIEHVDDLLAPTASDQQQSLKMVNGQPFGQTVMVPTVPHVSSTVGADSNHISSESVKTELVDDGRPCSSRLSGYLLRFAIYHR